MKKETGNRSKNTSLASPTSLTSPSRSSSPASPSSPASKASSASPASQKTHSFLKKQDRWESLYFYQKTDVLYQLTFAFAQRFLQRGDRTVDQMVQAARSGKQNIVEGMADGVTSSEMELKLLNVARASIKELREDYTDYLASRQLPLWSDRHPRYDAMLAFCREHNRVDDYQPFFQQWSDEEMANTAHTLCHMVDRMMTTYIAQLEERFVTQGGIRERMTAARLGYRTDQRDQLRRLEEENNALRAEVARLQTIIASLTSLTSPSSKTSPSSPTSQASPASTASHPS